MSNKSLSRRHFLRRGCGAAVALTGVLSTRIALAGEKVTEDDPMAAALGYKHDAASVDLKKFPKRAGEEGKTQFCNNCALYVTGDDKAAEWAPCSIFQNRLVAGKGWCNAWVPKS